MPLTTHIDDQPSLNMTPMIAIVFVIAMIRWTGVARLVRGEFMRLRAQEFVVAARAGASQRRRSRYEVPRPTTGTTSPTK